MANFLSSGGSQNIRNVNPGDVITIDEQLEKNIVKFNELAHGFYEFVIDQPAEVTVLQTNPNTNSKQALNQNTTILPPKSKSGAGRGLYGVSNYLINNTEIIDTQNGPANLIIADGSTDPWVIGKEGTTGQNAKLAGNYGLIYTIELKWKSTDGKALALVTWNARSGYSKWCNGMAASMVTSNGKFEAGVIQLPKKELVTKGYPEAVLVQLFLPLKNGEEQTIKITYSPPGASCLPTPLVFIPVEL